jgi:hypothetical protein
MLLITAGYEYSTSRLIFYYKIGTRLKDDSFPGFAVI